MQKKLTMDAALSVCVVAPLTFVPLVFTCWVNGKTVEEASTVIRSQLGPQDTLHFPDRQFHYNGRGSISGTGARDISALVLYEATEQYRAFSLLEHNMCHPHLLSAQTKITCTVESCMWIIEQYYSLEDAVVREMLGKRVIRSRKDLEDISDSLDIPLRSVTRQYDNLKRIQWAYEDKDNLQSNVDDFIETIFLLPPLLARKYSCCLFLFCSKFALAGKKRMAKLSCQHLEACGAVTMSFLAPDTAAFINGCSTLLALQNPAHPNYAVCTGGVSGGGNTSNSHSSLAAVLVQDGLPEFLISSVDMECWNLVWLLFVTNPESIDVDKQLLHNLRELRNYMTANVLDDACQYVRSYLTNVGQLSLVNKLNHGGKMRQCIKALLIIAAQLSQTREYRDFYEDLLTKIGEPLEEVGCSAKEINTFMTSCIHILHCLPSTVPSTSGSQTTVNASSSGSYNAPYAHMILNDEYAADGFIAPLPPTAHSPSGTGPISFPPTYPGTNSQKTEGSIKDTSEMNTGPPNREGQFASMGGIAGGSNISLPNYPNPAALNTNTTSSAISLAQTRELPQVRKLMLNKRYV